MKKMMKRKKEEDSIVVEEIDSRRDKERENGLLGISAALFIDKDYRQRL
jgi:hypothetical protein